jgi:hypothetical protein
MVEDRRRLIIRFVRPGEKVKRATLTYIDYIPQNEWGRIYRWATGESDELGKARKTLTVNIVATAKPKEEMKT